VSWPLNQPNLIRRGSVVVWMIQDVINYYPTLNITLFGSIYLMFKVSAHRPRKWLAHLKWREKWDEKTKLFLLNYLKNVYKFMTLLYLIGVEW